MKETTSNNSSLTSRVIIRLFLPLLSVLIYSCSTQKVDLKSAKSVADYFCETMTKITQGVPESDSLEKELALFDDQLKEIHGRKMEDFMVEVGQEIDNHCPLKQKK